MRIALSVCVFIFAWTLILCSEEISSVDCLVVVQPLPEEMGSALQPVIVMFKTDWCATGQKMTRNIMPLPRIYVSSDITWKTNISVGAVSCSVRYDESSFSNVPFSVSAEDGKDLFFASNVVVLLQSYTAMVSLTNQTNRTGRCLDLRE